MCCSALVAVIGMGATGCGIRTGPPGAPPPLQEHRDLQPAPEWVQDRVARTTADVYFDLDRDLPTAAARDALVRAIPELKNILSDFPGLVIVLEGHCDDRGSRRYNLRLANRRADSVRQILVDGGFPSQHLRTASIGNMHPQCFTEDEACRQKNRRVHLRAAQAPGEPRWGAELGCCPWRLTEPATDSASRVEE